VIRKKMQGKEWVRIIIKHEPF